MSPQARPWPTWTSTSRRAYDTQFPLRRIASDVNAEIFQMPVKVIDSINLPQMDCIRIKPLTVLLFGTLTLPLWPELSTRNRCLVVGQGRQVARLCRHLNGADDRKPAVDIHGTHPLTTVKRWLVISKSNPPGIRACASIHRPSPVSTVSLNKKPEIRAREKLHPCNSDSEPSGKSSGSYT